MTVINNIAPIKTEEWFDGEVLESIFTYFIKSFIKIQKFKLIKTQNVL